MKYLALPLVLILASCNTAPAGSSLSDPPVSVNEPGPAPTPSPSAPASPFSGGGSGTAQDPYRIATEADLARITYTDLAAHYELVDNIDLTSAPGLWPIGYQYERVSPSAPAVLPFSGVFDGNGYTIGGWHYTAPSSETGGVALFASLSGVVKNLTVAGFVIQADPSSAAGALAAVDQGGTEEGCHVLNSWADGISTTQ